MTSGALPKSEEKDEYSVQRQRAFWVAGAMGLGYLLFSGVAGALARTAQQLTAPSQRHPSVKDEEEEEEDGGVSILLEDEDEDEEYEED